MGEWNLINELSPSCFSEIVLLRMHPVGICFFSFVLKCISTIELTFLYERTVHFDLFLDSILTTY